MRFNFNITHYALSVGLLLQMSACYYYDGPTHSPVHTTRRELPPPPEKIVGKPVSKREYMEKTYQELKTTMPEADVVLIEDSIKVLFPQNIVYKKKDVFPDAGYQEPLARFSDLLLKYKKTNILISGHSDNRGNETANRQLSKERAQFVKQQILQHGVADYRLETWGLGSKSPIADNETEEGRLRNRRVEFVVLYQD
ncbi:MAG TPA: OmpA family protein [Chitinophagaceae bacterium]|nr:OmpA family protein [Chitinophagaceae bacterium]